MKRIGILTAGGDTPALNATIVGAVHRANQLRIEVFGIIKGFITHAVSCSRRNTAAIFPVARLNAARWLQDLPLRKIWLMQPRPAMPPGDYIRAGGKVGGGRVDFCWLVFEHGHTGAPELAWLHRDGAAS